MILGARSVLTSAFTGANLVLLRDWTLPIDALGSSCFKSFDEALGKFKSDSQATRIMPVDATEIIAGNLTTATEAAKRSLPERHRNSADFYSFTVANGIEPGSRCAWTDLPVWAHIHVETAGGDLVYLETLGKARPGLRKIPLEEGDLFAHISLFSKDFAFKVQAEAKPRFKRLSQVIDESKDLDWVWTLNVPLRPSEDS